MEAITIEEMSDLLIDICFDEDSDYKDELVGLVLDDAWSGRGRGGRWNSAITYIVNLLKTKMTDDEFTTLRNLVVQGMAPDEDEEY